LGLITWTPAYAGVTDGVVGAHEPNRW
jgi:hypothetical protein